MWRCAGALGLVFVLSVGCDPARCRAGTLYLTLDFADAVAASDAVAIDVTVASAHQSYTLPRTGSAHRDSIEIRFRSYATDAPITIEARALRSGFTVGDGSAQTALAPSCTTLTLHLDASGPLVGGDMSADPPPADSGQGDSDLAQASLDLAQSPLDLAQSPLDLAPAPPDLAQPAAPDLSTAPDLALHVPVITFTGESDTAQFPSNTSDPAYVDACPAGQAIIGFNLSAAVDTNGNPVGVDRADTLCAVPAVVSDGQGGLTVTWLKGATLTGHGATGAQTVVYQCKTNWFLTGFFGRSGMWLDQLSIACAPIQVANDGTISVGATVNSNTSVGGGGGSPFGPVYCPAGQVATMLRTRDHAGDPPDAFGFGCSTPRAQ